MGRFPESGIAAVLDLSKWSPNVRQYLKDVDAMDKADARAEKTALRTANAKEQLFKSLFKNISPLPPSLQAAASSCLARPQSRWGSLPLLPPLLQPRL